MDTMQRNPNIYLIEGILLIILGTFAISLPQFTTIAAGSVIGFVLLIGGLFKFFRTLKFKNEIRNFGLSMASGIIASLAGLYILANPIKGIYLLTILLAIYFLVDGTASVVMALQSKNNKYWNLLLLSGIITFILAVLIISGLPYSALWALGLLVGINLITYGFSITMAAASISEVSHKV
jgi:uncharacterized membrane protein HdeD (DUF308 family)